MLSLEQLNEKHPDWSENSEYWAEIDLLLETPGHGLWAIEIKLTSSPPPADIEKLNRHADLVKADRRFLISRTRTPVSNARVVSCDLPAFAREIMAL